MEQLKELQSRLESERSIEDIIICTIEEMSETTKVLTKYLRGSQKFSLESLTEEVAHSLLMLETVKNVFKLNSSELDNEKLKALKKCFDVK